MSKTFVIASVKANGTRWNVYLSDSKKTETFVAKEGTGYVGCLSVSMTGHCCQHGKKVDQQYFRQWPAAYTRWPSKFVL
jgi:hypothetical protein